MNKQHQPIIKFVQDFYDSCVATYNGEKRIDLTKNLNKTFSEIGLDSLAFIELFISSEEKFRISIDESDLPKEHTVEAFARMIYDKTNSVSNE